MFTSVFEKVFLQGTFTSTSVCTEMTGEGMFTGVLNAHMFVQVTFNRKLFTTIRACERFFAAVDSHVDCKM